MSLRDRENNNLSREERLQRKRARQERIKKRAKARADKEEAIVNTVYAGDRSKLKKSKFKEENEIKDRNNARKRKKGEKVKFKDLSTKEKMKKIFLVLFMAGLAFAVIAVIAIAILFRMLFSEDLKMDAKDILINKFNTEVYDRDGKLLATLADEQKRTKVQLKDMPVYLPQAYISIEDERFYKHDGVDFKRTLGATFNYIVKKGDSGYGGSTITQQVIKNITSDNERDWKRKIREISRAFQIEKQLSKDEILELYLNLIYIAGSNINGVALGADYYFEKNVKDLSVAQSAFLAGINHMPASYNPFMEKRESESDADFEKRKTKRMDMIKERTNIVLWKMQELRIYK